MFTAKTTCGYEITVNCDPDEFTWKKYFPASERYTYKYPDTPEFMTDYKIFGSEPHAPMPDVPRVGQKWIILKTDWAINGIEDDFFGMRIGDVVTIAGVDEAENGEWAVDVVVDDRMVDLDGFEIGELVTLFTQEHVQLKVIAPYTEC